MVDKYIYGIGQKTIEFMEKNKDVKFSAIIDTYQKSGSFNGLDIVDIKKLSGKKAQIYIVARKASQNIIYNNIKEFCRQNDILVYDSNGKLLREDDIVDFNLPVFYKDIDTMVKEAEKYDVISFDIFDTLLKRKCKNTRELFNIVKKNLNLKFDFVHLREKSEIELSINSSPGLKDIYTDIAKHIGKSFEQIEYIMEEEIKTDIENIYLNEEIATAYYLLLKRKKEINLVTDMYYSYKVISEILRKNNISGYSNLFVSCQYNTGKRNELFKIYKKSYCDSNFSFLHIGDDENSDYLSAKKNHIDAIYIKQIPKKVTPYELGYKIIGPCFFDFALNMIEFVDKNKIDKMIFVARDGYFPKKIYDKLYESLLKKNNSVYLPVSRSLLTSANIYNYGDILKYMKLSFDGDAYDILEKRFFLSKDEILTKNQGISKSDFILLHKEKILQKSKFVRENYLKILKSMIFENEKTAIFDFVSSGSCQLGIEKLLNKKLYGYYFEKIYDNCKEKERLNILDYKSKINSDTLDNYFFIEKLIKSYEGSLLYFDKNLNPVFSENTINKKEKDFIEIVRKAVMDYLDCKIEKNVIKKFEHYRSVECFDMLKLIGSNHIIVDTDIEFTNYDRLSNRKIKFKI